MVARAPQGPAPFPGILCGMFRSVRTYFRSLGPGIVTGAADDDPSGIATYSQTGAQYGFQMLWLALFSFPLMAIVQEMCARIALVSGRGLAANIRLHYPSWMLFITTGLLFAANAFNIGADLGAMDKAAHLLMPAVSFHLLLAFFALLTLWLQIFTSYASYSQYLKYMTIALLSYVAVALMVDLDWHEVAKHTLVPSITITKDNLLLVCAVLGTTISPYLFFWQTSQEIEEEILAGKTTLHQRRGSNHVEIRAMRIDVWSGMFFSNAVMFFIIAATAATLYLHGVTDIQTADQAAQALEPLAGHWAYLLFAVGIIGTGLIAVPVLAASASYAIAESLKWREGLYRKLHDAYAFYGVIIAAVVLGFVGNFVGIDPIHALIYSAVANAIVAPVMLAFVVHLSDNKHLMGGFANSRLLSILGWITVAAMTVAGVVAIWVLF